MEARWLDFPTPNLPPPPAPPLLRVTTSPPPLRVTASPPPVLLPGPWFLRKDGELSLWLLDWGAVVAGACQESLEGAWSRVGVGDGEGVLFVLGVWPCGFLMICTYVLGIFPNASPFLTWKKKYQLKIIRWVCECDQWVWLACVHWVWHQIVA